MTKKWEGLFIWPNYGVSSSQEDVFSAFLPETSQRSDVAETYEFDQESLRIRRLIDLWDIVDFCSFMPSRRTCTPKNCFFCFFQHEDAALINP